MSMPYNGKSSWNTKYLYCIPTFNNIVHFGVCIEKKSSLNTPVPNFEIMLKTGIRLDVCPSVCGREPGPTCPHLQAAKGENTGELIDGFLTKLLISIDDVKTKKIYFFSYGSIFQSHFH